MKLRILLTLATILLAAPSVSFSVAGGAGEGEIILALQDNPKVELFITNWCPYCKKAEQFFQSRGIPYVAYDIEKDKTAAQRKSQLDAQPGVPFAIINGQPVRGFSEQAYLKALKTK
jgi:glutaredoxin